MSLTLLKIPLPPKPSYSVRLSDSISARVNTGELVILGVLFYSPKTDNVTVSATIPHETEEILALVNRDFSKHGD